ncbi:MAG: hypothetical protein CL923_02715 [Deltaproteobacteria bacterium]|nr:hypothetical protein [Deltaproteobacteria bacterium]
MRGPCLFCGKGEENESEIQMQLILAPSAGNEKCGGGGGSFGAMPFRKNSGVGIQESGVGMDGVW